MGVLAKNKQVNVWRGPDAPPTIHHVWIRDDESLYLYNGETWVSFMEYPGLTLSVEDGKVKIASGEDYFYITTSGAAIGINTNVDHTVTITSDALNTIDTSKPLQWDRTLRVLRHLESGVTEEEDKEAGTNSDIIGSNSFYVPYIKVDKWGHVVSLASHQVQTPSVVKQDAIEPSLPLIGDNSQLEFPILLSPTSQNTTDGAYKIPQVGVKIKRQGNGVVTELVVPGLDVAGGVAIGEDLVVGGVIRGTVVGDVQGEAIPKEHASTEPTYGAGTAEKYGHVRLVSNFMTEGGAIIAPEDTPGEAATPLLVYRTLATAKGYTDAEILKVQGSIITPGIEDDAGHVNPIESSYVYSNDFKLDQNKLYINWLEV